MYYWPDVLSRLYLILVYFRAHTLLLQALCIAVTLVLDIWCVHVFTIYPSVRC